MNLVQKKKNKIRQKIIDQLVKNYRPISVLMAALKIFKRLIQRQMNMLSSLYLHFFVVIEKKISHKNALVS